MTRITATIDDMRWPKIQLVIVREGEQGEKVATREEILYDQAYSKFENALHNHLRVAVQQIINRRTPRGATAPTM
jgi:hypothetical protein